MSYKVYSNCIMDNVNATTLHFDENGMCNDCKSYYEQLLAKWNYGKGHEVDLECLLNKIKKSGEGKDYDCILGYSGGMDSAYFFHMVVKEWGLRSLVFHIDSDWDLPVGTYNVTKLAKKLGVKLHVEKLDQDDMHNFQIALFRTGLAGCLDYAQDHAFIAVLDEYALKHGIKYTLNGYNTAKEVISNPRAHSQGCGKGSDKTFLKDVLKKHSSAPLKHYQFTTTFRHKFVLPYLRGVKVGRPLDLIPYVKNDVAALLEKEYDWEVYKQKHFESLITKFLEGYWLPKRFGYDVRRHQLSALILTKQMTRKKALEIVSKSSLSEEECRELFKQIADKLQISKSELQSYFYMPKGLNTYKTANWMYKIGHKIMFTLGLDSRIIN